MASPYPILSQFVTSLGSLTNVSAAGAAAGAILYFDGANWSDTEATTAQKLTFGKGGFGLVETGAGTDDVCFVAPAALAASYTLTMPVDDGAVGQALSTDGSGVLSWATFATDMASLSDVSLSGAAAGALLYFDGASWVNTAASTTQALTVGEGGLVLTETGGGADTVTITGPAAATASYALALPPDDGLVGQVLTTDGSGALSWTTPGSGTVTGVASVGGGSFDVQSGTTGTTIDIKTLEDFDNFRIDEDATDRLTMTSCVTRGTSTTSLSVGDIVYYDKASGQWEPAAADAATTLGTAMVVKDLTGSIANTYDFGHWGVFSVLPTLDTAGGGGAPAAGDYVWVSTAGGADAGTVTAVQPTTSAEYNNPVGQRVSATQFFLSPWRAFLIP